MQRRWSQDLFNGVQWQDQRSGHKLKDRRFPLKIWKHILCDGDQVLGQVAQEGHGISLSGDVQKLFGSSPQQSALGGPDWMGCWTRWPPEVSSNLNHSVILWLQNGSKKGLLCLSERGGRESGNLRAGSDHHCSICTACEQQVLNQKEYKNVHLKVLRSLSPNADIIQGLVAQDHGVIEGGRVLWCHLVQSLA